MWLTSSEVLQMLKCLFSLFSVLFSPSLPLSCGRLQYNSRLTHAAKNLKELHLSLLFYEWKIQKWNKIDSKRLKRKRERAPPPHCSGNRQRCVWVSMCKHLRGRLARHSVDLYETMRSAGGRKTSSASTPDQLELRLSCSCLLRPHPWDWKPHHFDPHLFSVPVPETLNLDTHPP